MSKRKPYTFPHRSRAAMIAYLLDRRTYADRFDPYPFSWNVKAHGANWQHPKGENKLDSSLDGAWQVYMDENPEFCAWIFEDASHYYHKDWTSWPGDDQGDWRFVFAGRSGGHLCLSQWRGYTMGGRRGNDIAEILESLSFAELRKFYIGIRCADSDFTPAKASAEVEYQVNFRRNEWECEREAEAKAEAEATAKAIICNARRLEASRPDMYGK